MADGESDYKVGPSKPPLHTRFKKGQSGNPRGHSPKNLATLLGDALNEKVYVTIDGRRRKITKREAIVRDRQQIHQRQFARDRDADRYAEGRGAEGRRRVTTARASPVGRSGRAGGGATDRADPASVAAGDRKREGGGPARVAARMWPESSPPHSDPPFCDRLRGGRFAHVVGPQLAVGLQPTGWSRAALVIWSPFDFNKRRRTVRSGAPAQLRPKPGLASRPARRAHPPCVDCPRWQRVADPLHLIHFQDE
jgi:hypothetical protein